MHLDNSKDFNILIIFLVNSNSLRICLDYYPINNNLNHYIYHTDIGTLKTTLEARTYNKVFKLKIPKFYLINTKTWVLAL